MTNTQDQSKLMSQELRNIIDHARALVDATSGDLDERIKSARAALKERLDSVNGDYGSLEEQIVEKVQAADEFIHVKPYYAIGTTFVAGLLMGWFMSRK
jgi:ElaB/YqjD/DUF883 family membrane-anchored ribosome-binding protein